MISSLRIFTDVLTRQSSHNELASVWPGNERARLSRWQLQFKVRYHSHYKTQLILTLGVRAIILNDYLHSKLSDGTKHTLMF